MENTQIIRAALKAEGITECGFLPRTHFRVLNERLMQRCDGLQSAVVFLIPYRCDASPQGRAEHLAVRARKGLPRLFRRALRTAACGASEHLSRRTLCRLLRPLAHRRKGRRRTVRAGRSRPQFAADQRHLRQLRLYRLAADESGFKREPQLHRRAVLRLRPLRTRLPRIRNDGQRHRRGQMPIRDYAEKAQNARGRSPAAANRRRLGLRRLPARLPDEPRRRVHRNSVFQKQLCRYAVRRSNRGDARRGICALRLFMARALPSSPTTSRRVQRQY